MGVNLSRESRFKTASISAVWPPGSREEGVGERGEGRRAGEAVSDV